MKLVRLYACLALALGCGSRTTPVAEHGDPDASDPNDAGDAGDAGEDAGDSPCGSGYAAVPGLTSRYKMSASREIWIDAARACEADGAHLVVIDDAAENDWLSTIAASVITNDESSHQLVWIGLGDSRAEGTFRWITERSSDFMRWASGEPNSLNGDEDCVEIRPSGEWNDDRCNARLAYVCECDGATSQDGYCDTAAAATCGDCDTACSAEQSCVRQRCE